MSQLSTKNRVEQNTAELADRYWQNEPVEHLMLDRSNFVDDLLRELWIIHFGDNTANDDSNIALFAVGGFGRREMLPGSDVDLLVLVAKPKKHEPAIAAFMQAVFDCHLEVGHSVRTPKDCRIQAKNDITVATALFERRLIVGCHKTTAELDKIMASKRMWPASVFYTAKRREQELRHRQFDNVDYNLEPNIKESPGGLRDIHTALWVCDRQYGTSDPDELQALGVITKQENDWLARGRLHLLWVRFGLHLVAQRKQDQLQFEYQRTLAERLGYKDTAAKLNVEQFMHQYYGHVLALREVNDILLQHFEEEVIPRKGRSKTEQLNERFQIVQNYIEVVNPAVFSDTPGALLEMFVIMANRRDIVGVRANTIRLIRDSLHLIDDEFRANPQNTKQFIQLLKAPYTLVSQLTRMRRYGILGRYIPEYGEIIGQMQHDLFHIYTVDAHTMQVIGNMRRFRYRSAEKKYPVASHCVHAVAKIELLYIAGLYHDIGKGRGGDHSKLGADFVEAFCARHDLSATDTALISWLVQQHLLMSSTAQRKDIHDPDVIFEFASEVKSEMRLDYLYALTAADITATNPDLWNNWRATLLRQLYTETRRALRRGLESPLDRQSSIDAVQQSTAERLDKASVSTENIAKAWEIMGNDYFLRHTPRQCADTALKVLAHDPLQSPLVTTRELTGRITSEGASEITLFAEDRLNLFAASVICLDQLGLSVFEANVHTNDAGLCLNTYVVLDDRGEPLGSNPAMRQRVISVLTESMANTEDLQSISSRRTPRQMRQLARGSEVKLHNDDANYTTLTIKALDQPGLLAHIGRVLAELELQIHGARISTLGELAEDQFLISSQVGTRFLGAAAEAITKEICRRLDAELPDATP